MIVCILTWSHFLAARFLPNFTPPEILLLKLLGSAPELTFRPFFLFSDHKFLILSLLILLLAWRQGRPLVARALRIGIWLCAAVVAAMACATAYAFDHAAGLLPGVMALPLAILLGRWGRWRVRSTIVVAAGFAIGLLTAQAFYSFPFQDNYRDLVSPIWGFLPPVVVSLLAGFLLSLSATSRSTSEDLGPRITGTWGLLTIAVACTVAFAVEARGIRARPVEPTGSRILDDRAYDLHLTGDPPQLVWTNRQQIQVLTNPYGQQHERYTVDDDEAHYVERIWISPTGGFYIQGFNKFEWWSAPAAGQRLSYRPAARYRSPPWLMDGSSSLWTVAEDPQRRNLFTVAEYYSHYAVIERDSGSMIAHGVISSALWPFWSFTSDPPGRTLYITSALDDGALYEMNLDSLALERKASNLYLYETVLEPERNLLWGVRPLTGEVVAVDTHTYEMRYRVPVQFGLRDLQRDSVSGDLYTCSEIFGDIFRIDARTREVSRLGWCGRLCRDMFLDQPRRALWIATRDGICRIDVGAKPS